MKRHLYILIFRSFIFVFRRNLGAGYATPTPTPAVVDQKVDDDAECPAGKFERRSADCAGV